jgi:hypothetical protein
VERQVDGRVPNDLIGMIDDALRSADDDGETDVVPW